MNEWELPAPDDESRDFDGDLPPFATLLQALGDIDDAVAEDEATGEIITSEATHRRTMDIEGVTLSLAIELAVRPDAQGQVRVRGSTPTQWTATTVMPAFHKLTMHIAREPHGEE